MTKWVLVNREWHAVGLFGSLAKAVKFIKSEKEVINFKHMK